MDLSEIKIAHYTGQRIWMVRAQGGKYLRHFRTGSIISIEHLDRFYNHLDHGSPKIPSNEQIRRLILENERYIDKTSKTPKFNASGRNCFHQIDHFLNDIKKGDLVVSLDTTHIMIGVCTSSKAILSSRAIASSADPEKMTTVKLKHRLRKGVEWGPIIKRDTVGGLLKGTFQSRHTVTNLDTHWRDIFGLIYPFFTYNNELYFSNRIGTRSDINGKIISKLFDNLSSVQVILEELLQRKLSDEFVNNLLNDDIAWEEFDLTAKAYFGSPGGIFNKVPLPLSVNPKFVLRAFALAFLLTSGQVTAVAAADQLSPADASFNIYTPAEMVDERLLQRDGDENVDRLLGELARKNADAFGKIKTGQKTAKVKAKLRLSVPKHDTTNLEDKAGIKVTRVGSNAQ
ncbi:hypothetical protein GIW70_06740 [Pseudomonas syringae]|nr:hypothetical protein [Pseudomonas syringae]MCF5067895.1 hypothetical protein [Pseudomonas syringae]